MWRVCTHKVAHPWRRYQDWMKASPYVTNSITIGAIFGTGDYFCQKINQKVQQRTCKDVDVAPQSIDKDRLLRFTAYGLFWTGPLFCVWFTKLLPRLVPSGVTTPWKIASVKLLWDETLASLFFHSSVIYWMRIMKGQANHEAVAAVKHEFWGIYKVDLMVWPFLTMWTFLFVPLHMQPVAQGLFNVGWSAFLSSMTNQ